MNQRLCDMVGYTREELLAHTFQELTYPDDLAADLEQVRRLEAGEIQTYRLEKRYQRKEGSLVWVHLTVSLVSAAPPYFVAVIEDITARKQAEESVRGSEERFAKVFRAIPDAVAITRPDGPLLDVNDQWERLFGYRREEAIGSTPLALGLFVDPTDRPRIWTRLQEQGSVREYELAVRRRSGEERQMHLSVDLITVKGELCALAILHDITERKQMEEALRQSEARFKAQYLHLPIPTTVWQRSGDDFVLIDYNPAVATITEGKVAQGRGRRASRIYREDPAILEALTHAFHHQTAIHHEGFVRLKSTGEWKYAKSAYVFVPPDFVMIHREDLTARKQAEEAMRQAKDAAEAADRAKSEFLAAMSHELRTPVHIILGYTDLLLEDEFGSLEAAQVDTVRRIARNARVLFELISMVLDLNRLELGRLPVDRRAVEIAALLTEIQAETQWMRDQSGLAFLWEVKPPLPVISTDPGKLKVVLKNLLSNAMKYTPEGSVRITAQAQQGGVEISVADTGIGIPAPQREAIFEAFRQLDPLGTQGVGLGLYIVRRLLALLQGTITVESAVGQGSTFRVWVPTLGQQLLDISETE